MDSPHPTSPPWDGSDLGCFPEEGVIIQRDTIRKKVSTQNSPEQTTEKQYACNSYRYFQLQLPLFDKPFWCQVRHYKNSIPILIDELKPLFHLTKAGTHVITIDQQKYLLHQIQAHPPMTLARVESIDNVRKNNPYFDAQMREIYTFRIVLHITTNKHQIELIKGLYPRSLYESKMHFGVDKEILSENVQKEHFSKQSLEACLASLLRPDFNNLTEWAADLMIKVDEVINRIDPELAVYRNHISQSIINHLERYSRRT